MSAPINTTLFSLRGKIILVSGGARGLGLTQAEALIEHGAIVYALDRLEQPSEDFGRIQQKAESLGASLTFKRVDVTDVPGLNSVISSIAAAHNGIHGLIAAAGVQQETPALDFTAEDCNRLLGINVTGVMMTAQAAAKAMIAHRVPNGSIALIASMSGTIANRGLLCAPYNASKAAVQQLGRNLGSEWGVHGIRVNTISPGYIETEMVKGLFETHPERKTEWASQNFLGRIATPDDFKGVAVFLMSDSSTWMSGADLRIDGGHASW